MAEQSFVKSIVKKTVVGVVIGVVLVIVAQYIHVVLNLVTGATGEDEFHPFPQVFQIMFFIYAMLGAFVFILLDAPPMPRVEGVKAIISLLIFYVVLSGAYIGGASILPQYDPEIEKGKITKVLKLRKARSQQGKAEELIARAKVLNERARSIEQQLRALGGAKIVVEVESGPASGAAAGDLVALGLEQWDLQECYNCHKLFGKGGKKRGPKMDNIGNLMTPEQLREKILYPKSWKAEGFDKQFKKGKMPDKYKDLMFDEEVDALVAFLATLKDASVDTPKPIKMK